MGTRPVPFSRELWIEQDDFREEPPPKKYLRLSPGAEVRLRYAYIVKCVSVVHDERTGEVIAVRCTYDPATRGGGADREVKGTIHWVSAQHALPAEVRLYNPLFQTPKPDEDEDWKTHVNPNSLERLTRCYVEPSLVDAQAGNRYQFERTGYFCVDADTAPAHLVFNRIVSLRDTWAKIEKAEQDKLS